MLLSAHLDALFDRFLISFDDGGAMIVASQVKAADRKLLGVPRNLRRKPTEDEAAYLRAHAERFAELEGAARK